MRITICGSIRFIKEMKEAKSILENLGHDAVLPFSVEINQGKSFYDELRKKDLEEFVFTKSQRMRDHFEKIKSSDAVLVLNYDNGSRENYIGPNTFLEMAIAFDHSKKIFVINPLSENDPNYEELISMSPACLNGNLEKLKEA